MAETRKKISFRFRLGSATDLAEEPLEQIPRQTVPGDGVRDGGEDPVELAEHRASVVQLAGNLVDQFQRHLGHQPRRVLQHEPAERNLYTNSLKFRQELHSVSPFQSPFRTAS